MVSKALSPKIEACEAKHKVPPIPKAHIFKIQDRQVYHYNLSYLACLVGVVLSFQIHVTFQSAFRHSVTNGCPPIHAVIQHYICQVLQANTNYIQLLCFRLITFLLLSPSALQLWNFRFSIPPSQHQCTENSTCAVVALRRVCSAPSLITATCHSNFAGNLQKNLASWIVGERNVWRQYPVCFSVLVQTNIRVNIIRILDEISVYCELLCMYNVSLYSLKYVLCICYVCMYISYTCVSRIYIYVYIYDIYSRYYVHVTHIILHDCTYKETF